MRMGTVRVITLRWVGENTRGAIATGWKVPTRNETSDFWGRKVVHACRRMAFTHCLRRWRWIKRASIRNRRKVHWGIVWIVFGRRQRVVCLLGIIVAFERISWLSGLNTVRQRLILRLNQKIQNSRVHSILLRRPMGGVSACDSSYQKTSCTKKRKRHAFDEESVDDVDMTVFNGCDERR